MSGEIRRGVRRLFRLALRRPDVVREQVDDELQFFLDARVEHLVARGMSPEAARAEAVRRLGTGLEEARDRLHHSAIRRERRMRVRDWVDDLRQDVRFAARGLLARPGFTIVAVLTLAVGIGANTAIFSAVDALLLRPLPFPRPDRLMDVTLVSPRSANRPGSDAVPWSFPKFRTFDAAQTVFANEGLYSDYTFNITGHDAERAVGEWITSGYLRALGVPAQRGREFGAEADHSGAPRHVLISDVLWKRRFNADPNVVGRTMDIDRQPFEIVGVLPAGFRGLSGRAVFWIPIGTRDADDLAQAWSLEFSLVGRLAPGVTVAQAKEAVRALGAAVYRAWPMAQAAGGGGGAWGAAARSLDATRAAPAMRRSLFVLFGAVGFVLLIACANLANLLIGRAAARRREIAIRLALGAGRARLVRLLLTESTMLGVAGGAGGLLVAWWGTRVLASVNPATTLQAQGLLGLGAVGFSDIGLDAAALAFTAVVSVLVGVAFGLVPALQSTRPSVADALKGGGPVGRRAGHAHAGFGMRRALVVGEVALATVLLVGSGLMLRSLANLVAVDPGFDAGHLLTLRLTLPPGQTPRDSLPGFYSTLATRLAGLPGVTSVALADCPPLNGGCNDTQITFPDEANRKNAHGDIGVHVVSPAWFATLRVPLRRGRLLTDADRLGTPKVILINEAAARRYWPGENPVGRRAGIWQGGFGDGATVVGVVGDVRYGTIDSLPGPEAYMSYNQSPRGWMMIFVRTAGDPAALAGSARRMLRELVPDSPAYDVQTMGARVAAASAQSRFSAVLLVLFGAAALALATIGVYGVIAFGVVQRRREIGIRLALGADGGAVQRMVVGEGLALTIAGLALGLIAALALSRVLGALLFDVAPTDPLTYAGIAVLLGGAAVAASWVPARRAARVDPTQALRTG